jgi:hypothetical protein
VRQQIQQFGEPKNAIREMSMKRMIALLVIVLTMALLPGFAQRHHCDTVGGVLMTNINEIPYGPYAPDAATNLGPVFGDLAGSVTATEVSASPITFQHHWVTTAGDTIRFKPAVLTPTPTSNPYVLAVLWGGYRSVISGGTGKFEGATGYLDYFGLADFQALTLVLRYKGEVCYANKSAND